MTKFLRIAGRVLFALALIAGTAWSVTALWLNLHGAERLAVLAALPIVLAAILLARGRGRLMGWAALGLAAMIVAGWYGTLRPSAERDWASDVARGVTVDVAGDLVTLGDVRDFEWTTRDTATERWITAQYDLAQLETVDMITSTWGNPDIAHLLVSFGFGDGDHVVFSVEIRREAHEEFNEIGGFFRQFELVLIAATERDIVQLRTNHRREDVSLYPTQMTDQQQRDFFMAYVALAQRLEAQPAFYNTLTANCTTAVYALAKTVNPDLPLDPRIVLSGRLPEFVDELGLLAGDAPIAERRAKAGITARALAADSDRPYSQVIRAQ